MKVFYHCAQKNKIGNFLTENEAIAKEWKANLGHGKGYYNVFVLDDGIDHNDGNSYYEIIINENNE